ncbi:regulator of Vps4 activity in the MVB pathway protein [Medicago truncatula]|uniref:Regulator of Vps4 activity in the MVB pathway protein n=1 Tax=Medicago truncatula TaxID=3880 RepID=A0A072VBW2_MEDTR|nr:regulator of Vps4 activity in the MVB pathway protein [Medicago truncatula]
MPVIVMKVEQLVKDESLAAAYELLDQFCEFILTQLSYIRRHKDCPNDIKEAISSLIFASARCGDIPELFVIRILFGKRYGEQFATTAVELFPGNLVNKQLRENLSRKYVLEDMKYRVVDEIARANNCLQQNVLAIKYNPDWQKVQLKENKGYRLVESNAQINASISESKVHPSEIEVIERVSKPCESCDNLSKSSIDDSSTIVSIVQQYPQYIMRYPIQSKVEKVVEVDFPKLLSTLNSSFRNKEEKLALISSSEMIDYVDDFEEYQISLSRDGSCQEKMLFKFNSSGLFRSEKTQFGCEESDVDEAESPSESSSTRSSRRNKRNPRKRSRRRSSSIEKIDIVDIGDMIYYQKPCRSPSTHKDVSVQTCLEQGYLKSKESDGNQIKSEDIRRKNFKQNLRGCSLDQPCYFCLYDEKDCLETQTLNPKRVIEAAHAEQGVMLDECCHCRPFSEVSNGNKETKAEIIASNIVSNPRTNGSLTSRTETEVPYSRAMTMPQMRQKKGKDKMLRTYSCPSQHPNHVHPKLPDYDDIAAKFTALRREYLENKD